MIKNYLRTTFRNLQQNRVNFFFKLGGFTLALLSTLIIAVYISFHLSFDKYHKDQENIYRVNSQWMENGALEKYATVPFGIGPALKDEFPEVSAFARVGDPDQYLIKTDKKSFTIYGFTPADSSIFDVFTFRFIAGNKHALSSPHAIVLTQSLATQLYGGEDPIGKWISFTDRDNALFEVTGVVEDLPPNTHLNIKALLSSSGLLDSAELATNPWGINIDGMSYLYVKLVNQTQPERLASKANALLKSKLTPREDGMEKTFRVFMQPLTDIHLSRSLNLEFCNKGDVLYIYTFMALGLFLLLMASINYINLSIVDFQRRIKEISVRKILGASRKGIALQIILETFLFCLLALMLSLTVLSLLSPDVFRLFDPNLRWEMLFRTDVIVFAGMIVALLVLVSAAYPIYQLSAKSLMNNLQNRKALGGTSFFSNVLLLVQYSISIISVCATIVVGQQMKFIKTKDPGYDRKNIVVVNMPDRYPNKKIPVLKRELAALKGVEAVSYSTFTMAGGDYFNDWYKVEIDGTMKQMLLNEVFFDHDFFRATGLKIVAGRSFDIANSADPHSAFIVNETAVKEFGWKDPIGMRISYGYGKVEGEKWEGTVVGVAQDVNIRSLYEKIEPIVMRLPWSDWPGQRLYVRMNGPFEKTLKAIKSKYEEVLPDFVMDYSLMEDLYQAQYGNENRAFTILQWSTLMIALISSMGIFSLSVYMTMKRMKEFGIRKMLGATGEQITRLHIGHFIRIALLANAIALPVAYLAMKEWLDGFAYKMEGNNLEYPLVMLLSIFLVVASAGFSSLKAGRMNPLDVIKIQ
ncbi:MAG TPA: FtsX-like permease family protein [Chryseolinea sp.]